MGSYFDCINGETLETAIKKMIYDDGVGNPVININPNGSTLQPYFNCNRANISLEQVFRSLIIKDDNGNPVFNVAQS